MQLKFSLTKYGLNHLEYAASSEFDGPAVFSEVYYPRWMELLYRW